MKKLTFLFAVFALFAAACQPAAPAGPMTVTGMWARPAPSGQNSAAYFLVDNQTGLNDKLIGAKSDIAGMTEVHMTMGDGDTMSMQHVPEVEIASGTQVEFKPGGYHVMLMGLKRDLKAGDTFTLTLVFEKAGEVQVEVPVQEQ